MSSEDVGLGARARVRERIDAWKKQEAHDSDDGHVAAAAQLQAEQPNTSNRKQNMKDLNEFLDDFGDDNCLLEPDMEEKLGWAFDFLKNLSAGPGSLYCKKTHGKLQARVFQLGKWMYARGRRGHSSGQLSETERATLEPQLRNLETTIGDFWAHPDGNRLKYLPLVVNAEAIDGETFFVRRGVEDFLIATDLLYGYIVNAGLLECIPSWLNMPVDLPRTAEGKALQSHFFKKLDKRDNADWERLEEIDWEYHSLETRVRLINYFISRMTRDSHDIGETLNQKRTVHLTILEIENFTSLIQKVKGQLYILMRLLEDNGVVFDRMYNKTCGPTGSPYTFYICKSILDVAVQDREDMFGARSYRLSKDPSNNSPFSRGEFSRPLLRTMQAWNTTWKLHGDSIIKLIFKGKHASLNPYHDAGDLPATIRAATATSQQSDNVPEHVEDSGSSIEVDDTDEPVTDEEFPPQQQIPAQRAANPHPQKFPFLAGDSRRHPESGETWCADFPPFFRFGETPFAAQQESRKIQEDLDRGQRELAGHPEPHAPESAPAPFTWQEHIAQWATPCPGSILEEVKTALHDRFQPATRKLELQEIVAAAKKQESLKRVRDGADVGGAESSARAAPRQKNVSFHLQ